MNQKVKELAEQAGFAKEFAISGLWSADDEELERFAELIIEDCINGIKEWRDASDEHMDKEEYWKGYRSGCNDAIVEIIQRFGVEDWHKGYQE